MLELTSYGLTGLVVILLVAFCVACKGESTGLGGKPSPSSICDAELRPSKPVERCAGVANCNAEPQGQKHEEALNG